MASSLVLLVALILMALVFVGLSLAVAIRREVRERQRKRYEARASRLRPAMLRLLSEDEPDLSTLVALAGADIDLAESLAWSLMPKVRGAARNALAQWLRDRGAVDRAVKATFSFDAVGRSRAAEQLGSAGVIEVSEHLVRLLSDRRLEVRIVAARALGKLGDVKGVPHLLDALDGRKAVPMSLIAMALIHIGPAAIDELVLGLGRRSARARAVSAELLGIHGAYQAAKWLLLLVDHDPVDEVRVRAASALGRLGAPQGVQPLLRSISPAQSRPLRVAAARSLGQIGGDEAIAALHHAVQDSHPDVAAAAAEALAGLGTRGADVLRLVASAQTDAARRAQDWLSRVQLEEGRHRRRTRVAAPRRGA